MQRTAITLAALLASSLTGNAMAQSIDMNPGLWRNDTRVTFEGMLNLPTQQNTSEQCITDADLAEGSGFLDDMGGNECTVVDRTVTPGQIDYVMSCPSEVGEPFEMRGSLVFEGDRSSGSIEGEFTIPGLGGMRMRMEINGERIGEC